MRFVAVALFLTTAAAGVAQERVGAEVQLWADGQRRAAMLPFHEPYERGTSIAVPARARPQESLTAHSFVVRAWYEDDEVRVLVFARDRDRNEVQIATALASIGESWEVEQTEDYGAMPISVFVVPRSQG
jgi:hypothetical protein